jgi:hypothetical protein
MERLRAENDAQQSELSLMRQQLESAIAERSTAMAPLAEVAAPPIDDTQVPVGNAHPEVVADIKEVLEQVKAIYELDLNSNQSSFELVDSLTARLLQARDVIVGRASVSQREAIVLFEQQIDALMDSSGGTSFGRHLSIAAYAVTGPATSTCEESGK